MTDSQCQDLQHKHVKHVVLFKCADCDKPIAGVSIRTEAALRSVSSWMADGILCEACGTAEAQIIERPGKELAS